MKDENLGLTSNFSACETAERERRRVPGSPWLGEMEIWGLTRTSLWSAQASTGQLALSTLLALPAFPMGNCKVYCIGLPDVWEPFPGACGAFALWVLPFH